MATWLASLLALGFCYAGMAGLCLGMDRHYKQVWQREPRALARRGLRGAGWLLLALALLPCLRVWGASVGVVIWLGFLTAGAVLVVWLLPYRPRWATGLALCGALVALAVMALNTSA